MQAGRWTSFIAADAPRAALGVLLVAAAGLNIANVIGRYVFSSPIQWADEAMVFMMVASVFIGVAPVAWDAGHLRMDLLLLTAPARIARVLQAFAFLASLVACAIVFSQSLAVTRVIWRIGQTSPVLEMPMWILHGAVAFGLGLGALALLLRWRTHLAPPRLPGTEDAETGNAPR